MIDEHVVDRILELAKIAYRNGEVPVAAVIVKDGKIIAEAVNEKEGGQAATEHAEILAIQRASKSMGTWRLEETSIYVSLEPCIMCMGAILSARIPKLVYLAYDYSEGAFNGRFKLSAEAIENMNIEIVSGYRAGESAKVLKSFFASKR